MSDERRRTPRPYGPHPPAPRFRMRLAARSKIPNLTKIAKILVGPEVTRRIFYINEDFLKHRSEFFKRALEGSWVEAQTHEVRLEEQDGEIFALYEKFIYFGLLPVVDDNDMPGRWAGKICKRPEACEQEYNLLVRLYLLADYLIDDQAKMAAVDAIRAKVKHECDVMKVDQPCMPPIEAIKRMYDEIPSPCSGRQVLVDCFVWYGGCGSIARVLSSVPMDFHYDVIRRLVARREPPKTDMLTERHEGSLHSTIPQGRRRSRAEAHKSHATGQTDNEAVGDNEQPGHTEGRGDNGQTGDTAERGGNEQTEDTEEMGGNEQTKDSEEGGSEQTEDSEEMGDDDEKRSNVEDKADSAIGKTKYVKKATGTKANAETTEAEVATGNAAIMRYENMAEHGKRTGPGKIVEHIKEVALRFAEMHTANQAPVPRAVMGL